MAFLGLFHVTKKEISSKSPLQLLHYLSIRKQKANEQMIYKLLLIVLGLKV